jgi:hypothetical protein
MSKEAAAAILVQTLFTADKSMQNLVMSHAKVGTAEPKEVVKFIMPYYREMLKAMDSKEGEENNAESGDGAHNSSDEAKPKSENSEKDKSENEDEQSSVKKAGA